MSTSITKPKRIALKPADRTWRDTVREAHDTGRHGADDAPLGVLAHWAENCGDCNARYFYEVCPGEFARK